VASFSKSTGIASGTLQQCAPDALDRAGGWADLAQRVLEGHRLTPAEGLCVLRSPDAELLDLLAAAYRVRHRWFGNAVHLNFLVNAKSGMCGEDCTYCAQSSHSAGEIERYALLSADRILDGARMAAQRKAGTYCIVTSGRGPGPREMELFAAVVPRIKREWGLRICVSPGLLTPDQAAQLKACGVDRVNHNLNTSRRMYPAICTTHDYADRLGTLEAIRRAGLEICCGGIVGMGEEDVDVVELALHVGRLEAEAVPINFLIPIEGIRAAASTRLNPRYCLKVLSLFRLANPRGSLRVAAGREIHLGPLQPLALYPANSLFVGDYLTAKGQPPEDDYRMIEALGFVPVLDAADG
jgi:biotin synthase